MVTVGRFDSECQKIQERFRAENTMPYVSLQLAFVRLGDLAPTVGIVNHIHGVDNS